MEQLRFEKLDRMCLRQSKLKLRTLKKIALSIIKIFKICWQKQFLIKLYLLLCAIGLGVRFKHSNEVYQG